MTKENMLKALTPDPNTACPRPMGPACRQAGSGSEDNTVTVKINRVRAGKNPAGQILIGALFVLIVVAILGMVVVSMISTESFSVIENMYGVQALNLAEAGTRFTVATSLAADSKWSDNGTVGPVTLSPGTFTIKYLSQSRRACTLESTGTVNGVSRVVQVSVRKVGLPNNFDYGSFTGNPGGATLYVQQSAHIAGDFYYKGPIIFQNSAWQDGGIIYCDSLDNQGHGTIASWEIAPTLPIPTWNNSYYDNILTLTGVSTTLALSASNIPSDPWNLNGGTYYFKGIDINAKTINGPGTLVATGTSGGTGNIEIKTNAQINNQVRLVAKNDVTLSNNKNYGYQFEIYANGNIDINNGKTISQEATIYSKSTGTSISISNGTTVLDGSSFLAPYGTVKYGNTFLQGLIYCATLEPTTGKSLSLYGAVSCYSQGQISNNSEISFNPEYLPSVVWGLGGMPSLETTLWREAY